MKTANYIILINKEGSPVLVEVPKKPKFSAWDLMSPAVDTDTPIRNYNEALQQALSDTSKHIRLKDENSIWKYLPYSTDKTFPLPSNVSVSFAHLCNCELATLKGSPTMCFACLRPGEHKIAILTESTTKQEEPEEIILPDLSQENKDKLVKQAIDKGSANKVFNDLDSSRAIKWEGLSDGGKWDRALEATLIYARERVEAASLLDIEQIGKFREAYISEMAKVRALQSKLSTLEETLKAADLIVKDYADTIEVAEKSNIGDQSQLILPKALLKEYNSLKQKV